MNTIIFTEVQFQQKLWSQNSNFRLQLWLQLQASENVGSNPASASIRKKFCSGSNMIWSNEN